MEGPLRGAGRLTLGNYRQSGGTGGEAGPLGRNGVGEFESFAENESLVAGLVLLLDKQRALVVW